MPSKSTTSETTLSDFLLERVHKHYASSTEPLLLSTVGLWVREKEAPTLPPLLHLKSYCAEEVPGLYIIVDPVRRARIAVATGESADSVRSAFATVEVAQASPSRAFLASLPRALIVAFCRDLSSDTAIFFRVRRPFRYDVAKERPSEDHVPIGEALRSPGVRFAGVRSLSDNDATQLAANIRDWLAEHDLSASLFKRQPTRPSAESVYQQAPITALHRLVQAQPESLRRALLVPADIIELLLRHP